jgi:hypothetical protein
MSDVSVSDIEISVDFFGGSFRQCIFLTPMPRNAQNPKSKNALSWKKKSEKKGAGCCWIVVGEWEWVWDLAAFNLANTRRGGPPIFCLPAPRPSGHYRKHARTWPLGGH